MNTFAKIIGFVALGVLAIAFGWAVASFTVFVGLNFIAGYGLNFAQVIGIGVLLAAASGGGATVNNKS